MSESDESKEKVTPDKESSPIGKVIEADFNLYGQSSRYAHTLMDANTKEIEQIARRQDALDSALLNKTISEERAREEMERLREDRKQVNREAHEAMQFIAQINRDLEPAKTLFVNRMMEKGKLDYDYYKHFTTLGTGSILFIVALTRVIFPNVSQTESLSLLFVSFAFLAVSVMTSALAMKGAIVDAFMGQTSEVVKRVSDVSWSSFSNGIILFVVYVGVNISGLSFPKGWLLTLLVLGGFLLGSTIVKIVSWIRK